MKYHFRVHGGATGYWAECMELTGCASEGESYEELKLNLAEALNGILDEPAGSNMVFPMPDKKNIEQESVIEISVEPAIAFSLLVRQTRIANRMSQAEAQEAMGFKSRNSYARLERKANPSLDTIVKVKKVFPDIPIEECFA